MIMPICILDMYTTHTALLLYHKHKHKHSHTRMSSNKFMSKNDIILIIQWQGDLCVTNRMPEHISPMHVRVIPHIYYVPTNTHARRQPNLWRY